MLYPSWIKSTFLLLLFIKISIVLASTKIEIFEELCSNKKTFHDGQFAVLYVPSNPNVDVKTDFKPKGYDKDGLQGTKGDNYAAAEYKDKFKLGHTEELVLKEADRLINEYKKNNDGELPTAMYLYTYNSPCRGLNEDVSKNRWSCSQKIADFMKGKSFKMYVAWDLMYYSESKYAAKPQDKYNLLGMEDMLSTNNIEFILREKGYCGFKHTFWIQSTMQRCMKSPKNGLRTLFPDKSSLDGNIAKLINAITWRCTVIDYSDSTTAIRHPNCWRDASRSRVGYCYKLEKSMKECLRRVNDFQMVGPAINPSNAAGYNEDNNVVSNNPQDLKGEYNDEITIPNKNKC